LEEAAAAICMVHVKVSKEMEAAISLKMVIPVKKKVHGITPQRQIIFNASVTQLRFSATG